MHRIKEVLRLTAAGLSQRQIARSLHLSHGVVAKYQVAAQLAGLNWPLADELDDEVLRQQLWSKTSAAAVPAAHAHRTGPDFAYVH